VLAFDGMSAFELGIVTEVFGLPRPEFDVDWYDLTICAEPRGQLRLLGRATLTTRYGLAAFAGADTVIVPGVADVHAEPSPAVVTALRKAHRRGARVVSICSGAFALAAAGLLDGRPAATHWAWADRLSRLYPQVNWNFDVLFVDDGDILTSAGVGAGVDLCLHIVRGDHGAETANRAARRCVVPAVREGGQAQYIERPVPASAGSGTEPTRAWALDRLAEPVSLEEMAAHARMSVRTFTRRFREETGMSPRQWLLRQRVAHAQLLLESTDLGVETVARRSGLGSATALRQHLQATIGVAPSAYRKTFRHPAASTS